MASNDNTVARTLHDLGLAAWFGGSLMGATGVNGAAAVVQDPTQRLRVANSGWARWTPLNLAGIAAHLAGGAVLTGANKGRLAGQQGVATASTVKTALTVAALGTTAYARVLGKRLERPATSRWREAHHPEPGHPRRGDSRPAAAHAAAVGDPSPDRGGAGRQRPHGRAATPHPGHQGPDGAADPRSLAKPAHAGAAAGGSVVGHEVAVGVPVRTIYRGRAAPAPWSAQASAHGAGGDKDSPGAQATRRRWCGGRCGRRQRRRAEKR